MPMLGLWGVLCTVMIVFASLTGYGYAHGGRSFVAAFATFGLLLGGMLLFAARKMVERVAAAGAGGGWLLGIAIFLVYLLYVLGTGTVSFLRLGEMALFLFLPLALLSSAGNAAAGSWQDFFVIACIWVAVKFGPAHSLWPYPGGRMAYILTLLLAVNLSISGFFFLARV